MGQRNGDRFWLPRLPNCIGWIHREMQDFAGALKFDQQGLEVGREHHVLEAQANSLINLGIDYTHSGRVDETLSVFHEVHDIFGRDAWFRWRYDIRLQAATAEHWLSQGDLQQARDFAQRLLGTAAQHEAHKYIAVAHELLGRLAIAEGDKTQGEKEFAAALEELDAFPAPLIGWKTYAAIGRLKLELGDSLSGREAFAQAAKIVNSIAAKIEEKELRETFLNSAAVQEVQRVAASS
jgi:tetratricopeptide (TPR) repeat protein